MTPEPAGMNEAFDFDYVIVGSGFGGSVAALRLAEKGYRVKVIEKGRWLGAGDFPRTNWHLRRWLWAPRLGLRGLFKITLFRHVGVLSGVGVGGGSLVYANTLPTPKPAFFTAASWAHLADWEAELAPFYPLALRMLGAATNPRLEPGDERLREMAAELGIEDRFEATRVAVYFGKPGTTAPDPYFDGAGPDRTGCIFCGGCMLGCRYDAKNTLDKNYLHLAQQLGVQIQAESEVVDVAALGASDGADGYRISWRHSLGWLRRPRGAVTARGVIFAGGVMGTVPMLLKLRENSLPRLSARIGFGVRTNSEALIGVTSLDPDNEFSRGVAIGSILHTDAHSHLEPVRYSRGAGFWRLFMSPLVSGPNVLLRLARLFGAVLRHPWRHLRAFFIDDWSRRTQILLFMQTIDSTLRFVRGRFGMSSRSDRGSPPTAFIPEAQALARRYAEKVDGVPTALLSETLLGIPTTAHILGGAVMGKDAEEGVIDSENRVFGYRNMYICDGSTISANPGVNPSLTITALAERALSRIPPKDENADNAR